MFSKSMFEVLSSIGMQRVMEHIHAPLYRVNQIEMFLLIISGTLGLISFVVTLAGYYIWLSNAYPLSVSLIIFGATVFILSLLIIVSYFSIRAAKEKKILRAQENLKKEIHNIFLGLKEELPVNEIIRDNMALLLIVALISGIVAGDKISK